MAKLSTQLDRDLDLLLRSRNQIDAVLVVIREAIGGQPGAASWDASPRGGDIVDPTGDAGTNAADGHDRARSAERALVASVASVGLEAERIMRILNEWRPGRPPTPKERQETEAANRAQDGCESCWRIEKFSPTHRTTDLDDILERPHRLDRWCYDFTRKVGRLPTRDELRRHHQGKKVKVPVTDRLRQGLVIGVMADVSL
jgi:hypothetical protein